MPKNKFQDVIFTIIMATIMVYGMVVYNVALNTGTVNGKYWIFALGMKVMLRAFFFEKGGI